MRCCFGLFHPFKKKRKVYGFDSAYRAFVKKRVTEIVELEENSRKYPTVKFSDELRELEDVGTDEILTEKKKERVQFVSNIMSQTNPLISNPSKQRVLIGKGPVELDSEMLKAGNIFLFNDLLIVSTRIIDHMRYVREICFNLEKLTVARSNEKLTLSDGSGKHLDIRFEETGIASLWEQYISYKTD